MKTMILPNGKKLTAYRVKKWYSLTDANEHNQVRIEIAKFFNECKHSQKLIEICEKAEKFLTITLFQKRLKLTYQLLKEIRKLYGNEVMEMVLYGL